MKEFCLARKCSYRTQTSKDKAYCFWLNCPYSGRFEAVNGRLRVPKRKETADKETK